MRRFAGPVAFVVLVLVTLYPLLAYGLTSEEEAGHEPTHINRYAAVFDVGADGDVEVTETIEVEIPSGTPRRGIFRFFDLYDANQSNARREPKDVRVTRDGWDERYEKLSSGVNRFRTLKIGSEHVTLTPGPHTYVISYRIEDVLLAEGDGSRFYWNLIPSGWAQRIDAAQLTVRLPEAGQDVRCAVGTGTSTECGVAGRGTSTLVFTASDLKARTPVTAQVDLPTTQPSTDSHLPWSLRWAEVLGGSWTTVLIAVVGVLFAGWYGHRLARRTYEDAPGFPLMYSPPEGVGPMQALYVKREAVPEHAFVAGLVHAAERGAITLERNGKDWQILPRSTAVPLDDVTAHGLVALGVAGGQPFTVKHRDVTAGKKLQAVIASSTARTKEWAASNHLVVKDGPGWLGAVGVIAAFVFFCALVSLRTPGTLIALVPGAFAAFGLPMLFPGASTRRTPQGRRLWSEVGGFRRVLATPSSEDRFEFSGRHELYTAYIPWAMAFGCADEWARKYQHETGQEPPTPPYVMGVHHGGLSAMSAITRDFSSTLDGAISAYRATQSSSSSGGGFSGGGGGGGGGGGSW